jgi:hypothetical protein
VRAGTHDVLQYRNGGERGCYGDCGGELGDAWQVMILRPRLSTLLVCVRGAWWPGHGGEETAGGTVASLPQIAMATAERRCHPLARWPHYFVPPHRRVYSHRLQLHHHGVVHVQELLDIAAFVITTSCSRCAPHVPPSSDTPSNSSCRRRLPARGCLQSSVCRLLSSDTRSSATWPRSCCPLLLGQPPQSLVSNRNRTNRQTDLPKP